MPARHEDNDGSDIFWPGYVDATTNLILSLLFLLTILIVAVFMFALEMGRMSKAESVKPPVAVTTTEVDAIPEIIAEHAQVIDPVQENIQLKSEIQRLNKMLAQQVSQNTQSGDLAKTADATSSVQRPLSGLDKTVVGDFEVVVRFKDEAVAFTPSEHERLLESLQPIEARGEARIYVEVPAGFSEAKRMGFYRAMAVRNLLIEMEVPQEKIDVAVVEGKKSSNASVVRVRSR